MKLLTTFFITSIVLLAQQLKPEDQLKLREAREAVIAAERDFWKAQTQMLAAKEVATRLEKQLNDLQASIAKDNNCNSINEKLECVVNKKEPK